MVAVSELKGSSEQMEGEFEAIGSLISTGETIDIKKATLYTNDKGDGVIISFRNNKGEEKYTCTHSIGIVAFFKNSEVKAVLESGNTIDGKFIIAPSKTDPYKKVYKLV